MYVHNIFFKMLQTINNDLKSTDLDVNNNALKMCMLCQSVSGTPISHHLAKWQIKKIIFFCCLNYCSNLKIK